MEIFDIDQNVVRQNHSLGGEPLILSESPAIAGAASL
jgi:hypothetical protein